MDFRAHQDKAKENSLKIWGLYIVLLLFASLTVGIFITLVFDVASIYSENDLLGAFSFGSVLYSAFVSLFDFSEGYVKEWNVLAVISLIFMLVSTIIGFFKSSNGHDVAKSLGGYLIDENTENLSAEHKMALNIITELSLASSISAPALYVVDDNAINAFAAGKDLEHSVVALTTGAINNLNREELSAIVGHELGHIVNKDIKLNIKISAFVLGFTAIYLLSKLTFNNAFYGRHRDAKSRMMMVVLGVGLVSIGFLTVYAGRILQAKMSREREYLADASATQFTRNPKALISAFEKIKQHHFPTKLSNPLANEVAHALFFGRSSSWFATHPSLDDRIARLSGK